MTTTDTTMAAPALASTSPEQTPAAPHALAALYEALALAQGAFQPIENNREGVIHPADGDPFTFRYADLQEINTKTRPALSSNGLALNQVVQHNAGAAPMLICRLMHKGGGVLVSELELPTLAMVPDPKQLGALLTYFRRYLASGILGVAADDDLDSHTRDLLTGAARVEPTSGKPSVVEPQPRTEGPAPARAALLSAPAPSPQAGNAPADTAPCTSGEIAYIKRKLTAKAWSIAQACQAAGVAALEDIAQMTKGHFDAIKAVV